MLVCRSLVYQHCRQGFHNLCSLSRTLVVITAQGLESVVLSSASVLAHLAHLNTVMYLKLQPKDHILCPLYRNISHCNFYLMYVTRELFIIMDVSDTWSSAMQYFLFLFASGFLLAFVGM